MPACGKDGTGGVVAQRQAVMAWIGVEPPGNITPRESGQTSTGSLITKELDEPTKGGKANVGRIPCWCGLPHDGRLARH